MALTSILGFDMCIIDVDQDYLQFASKLRRKILVKPDVLGLGPDKLLQLMKLIYGLAESGHY